MSNESWMKKFNNWQPDENKKYKHTDDKKQCDSFEVTDNGFCKNYIGCQTISNSCIRECILKSRC